jgi:hypothetical protein
MNKPKRIAAWSVSLGLMIGIAAGASIVISKADGAPTASQPGSVDDPVVTKSYVDEQIAKLRQQTPPSGNPGSGTGNGEEAKVTVVKLEKGQILYAGAGSELIVRTGRTIAVSNDDNGIPDVTAGKDITAGTAIENNHLLMFPREGRGVKPDPKNTADIYIMVKGSYLVLDEK